MGKSGPCCHCGITSTPLWRNGPPGKPVLCNACGSRWRTKGTLENYTPLHCHGFLPVGSEFCRKSQENNLSLNTNARSLHMNQNEVYAQYGDTVPGHESKTGHEDDTSSNGSSSGSGLSISESCILGSMDGNSISGPVQSHLWNSYIPSRKRTINKCQSPSPVEKLRRDLYNILQEQKSTYLSGSLEEVLLFERDDLMLSVETDLGSILLKHPSSSGEEESEASSLMIRNKVHCLSDTNLRSSFSCVPSQSCEVTSSPRGKRKVLPHAEQKVEIKEHPVKRRALADILLEEIPVNNLNAFERNHSPPRSKVLRSKNEDLKLEKETSSCSSKIVGGATALLPGRALSQQDTSSCSSRSVRGPTTLPTRRPLSQQQYQISGVEKGSVNAQNHGATNLHLLQASSRTIGVFRKGMMPIK